jgi:hypothetical protein
MKELPKFFRISVDYSVTMSPSLDRVMGHIIPGALPVKRLVAGFPQLRPRFDTRSGYVEFVVDIMALLEVFPE